MLDDPAFYVAAFGAILILGLAKGGFSGIGILGVPLMALVIPPVQAAAILLPVLLVQDVVSVWAFRRSWDSANLKLLLPAAALGVGLAWLFAASAPGRAVALAVGVVSLGFGLMRMRAARRPPVAARPHNRLFGALCGVVAGFTSTIAHAGGPPFQIYVLPQRLERDRFIGTSAIFFAAVNWMKVPAFAALGELSRENLIVSAILTPFAIASTWAGVWLVRRVSGERFYALIDLLMVLVGLKLIGDGLALW